MNTGNFLYTLRPLAISLAAIIFFCSNSYSADLGNGVSDGNSPVDVPDEFGLGERLALLDWLKEHHVMIVVDADLPTLRRLFLEARQPAVRTAPPESPPPEREELILQLWLKHNLVANPQATLEDLRAQVKSLDEQQRATFERDRQDMRDISDRERALDQERKAALAAQQAAQQAADLAAKTKPVKANTEAKDKVTVNSSQTPQSPVNSSPEPWSLLNEAPPGNGNTTKCFKLLRKTFADLSAAHGSRTKSWYALSERTLELGARYLSVSLGSENMEQLVRRNIDNLVKLTCDDPGILLLSARLGNYRSGIAGYFLLEKHKAPLFLRLACARATALELSESASSADKYQISNYQDLVTSLGLEALREYPSDPAIKVIYSRLLGQVDSSFRPAAIHLFWLKAYQTAIDQGSFGDRWVAHMVKGEAKLATAWKARGNGWAKEVTEDGWKIFNEDIKVASEEFEAALQLEPNQPEPVTFRIAAAMSAGEGVDAIQSLLKRALAISADIPFAYTMAFEGLSPQWGGSCDDIISAGRIALLRLDYTSNGPNQYIKAMEFSTGVRGRSVPFEKLWPDMQMVLKGYVDAATPATRPWHLSRYIAYAYKHKHQDIVAEYLPEIQGKLDIWIAETILGDSETLKELLAAVHQTYKKK